MASEYTPNYNLDLYVSGDAPNLRDQYNAAMGKIDTQLKTLADGDVTINNMIAGINRDIAAINTAQNKLVEDVTALQTLTSSQGSAIEQDAQRITSLEGYFQALGIASIDEAQDLLEDINDAHTTAMTNQADIAVMKPQVAGLQTSVSGLETDVTGVKTSIQSLGASVEGITANVETLNTDVSNLSNDWDTFDITNISSVLAIARGKFFINKAKTLIKIAGEFQTPLQPSSTALQLDQIPGVGYGFALVNTSINPPSNITYAYSAVGYVRKNDSTGEEVRKIFAVELMWHTNGIIYALLGGSQSYQLGVNNMASIIIAQPILTTSNYTFTPIDPDEV